MAECFLPGLERDSVDSSMVDGWTGPGGEEAKALLRGMPKRYAVSVEDGAESLSISFRAARVGCIMLAVLSALTVWLPLAFLVWDDARCGFYSAQYFKIRVVVTLGMPPAMLTFVVWLCRSRLFVVLEPDFIRLERRGVYVKELWWLPRNAIKQLVLVPPMGFLGAKPLGPTTLIVRGKHDHVVQCGADFEGILCLGRVLSAWSGVQLTGEPGPTVV